MDETTVPRIKVCGLTTLAAMRVAESWGANYVGLIVEVARSPRSLARGPARLLARAARARPVLVTTLEDAGAVIELAAFVQPAVVQLHSGPETAERVRRGLEGIEVWPVVAVATGAQSGSPEVDRLRAEVASAITAGADKIVLDSARGGQSGGTGSVMDWGVAAELVSAARATPVILAGGLDPWNVAEAIRRVRPRGVDVSSGVESSPGVKSAALIRAFCREVTEVT